ncbi:MAG: DUF2851 family protein [Chitinophagaceae bacterium]
MTERLLQFIWQFQYFNKSELTTTTGEPIHLISHGSFNTNQGPDFMNAKIRIGSTLWAGSVEMHIHTSDWKKHNHQKDKNYKNVILHVVWEDDGHLDDIPILELKSRVPKLLLLRYQELMDSTAFIPCEKSIHTVKEIAWKSWKERLLAERLLSKSKTVETYLEQNNHHWEETFWWLLARNFGIKVNAGSFEDIARSISLKILAKHKNHVYKLEALLFGQAGLLDKKFEEEYPTLLQKEYSIQQRAYNLRKVHEQPLFLRMRPGSFPTIRLAQLAVLVHDSAHLFSAIKEENSIHAIKNLFAITAQDYWDTHYRFDEVSVFKKKRVGETMIGNIIINAISPLLFTYGQYHGEQQYKDKAIQWLEETEAEINTITTGFNEIGIISQTAYDSQALLELKTQYCDCKRCLDCSMGNFLLKTE